MNVESAARAPIRVALDKIMRPIVDEKIAPFVLQHYPTACNMTGKTCRVCSSLLRRYKPDEDRSSHNVHRDSEAIVTVVISLSDYGTDYQGGLYVSNGHERHVLPLMRGDALVHQSDLLHGVLLHDDPGSLRYSWILWFKDDDRCVHRSYEWSRACAESGGNHICEYLQGLRASYNPAGPWLVPVTIC